MPRFQSLQGTIQTRMRTCRRPTGKVRFQSLQGTIQTRLLGRRRAVASPGFNPFKVRSKLVRLSSRNRFLPLFQSLQGTIQTLFRYAFPARRCRGFNPFKVRSKRECVPAVVRPEKCGFNPFKVRSKQGCWAGDALWRLRVSIPSRYDPNAVAAAIEAAEACAVSIPSRYDPNAVKTGYIPLHSRCFNPFKVRSKLLPSLPRAHLERGFNPFKVRSKRRGRS